MNFYQIITFLIIPAAFTGCSLYLFQCLKKRRQIVALVGLFSMAMGLFLLIMDLVLVAFLHGPQHILDYLLFNRLVSDTGFAGRWMMTVYLFIITGIIISIYLLATNTITKFNKRAEKG